jgi:hypothetical protein
MALDLSKSTMHRGKLSESCRRIDYEFWREQTISMKMAAIWEMTIFHHMVKNRDPNELRLNRAIGGFRKKRG